VNVFRLHPNVRRYIGFLWIVMGFMVLAGAVALYIVRQERLRYPWEDVLHMSAEFTSAQAVTPGQGQQVTIAGVKVGEIGSVSLDNGRASVRMDLDPHKVHAVYRDVRLLLRPKTGLNDMSIQMDPGKPDPSLPGRGRLREGAVIPASQTMPNVNPDEVFAGLDVDSRRYLAIIANAGGQGLNGRGPDIRAVLRAAEPTLADTARVTRALADRKAKLRRLVSNLSKLSHATAGKDRELTELVRATSAVVSTVGDREARLGDAVDRLPGALGATREALQEARPLAEELRPAAQELRPVARELGPSLQAARPLLRDALPTLRDHVRPLVREATPLVRDLNPAVRDVNASLPPLLATGPRLHRAINEMSYNPPGPEEGYLFWAAWFFHNANSILSIEDAHGASWRGLVTVGCSTLATATAATPALAPLAESAICPQSSIVKAARR
jgi:phospholipid/cholesterol/gamma-HCH transport system substrate-binding protein